MPFFGKKSDKKGGSSSKHGKGKSKGHKRTPSQGSSHSATSDFMPNGDIGLGTELLGGAARPNVLLLNSDSLTQDDTGEIDGLQADSPQRTSSRLSKTILEILHDKDALPYFIQFMHARSAEALIKFWLDSESFQVSSWTRIRTHSQASVARSSSISKTPTENTQPTEEQITASPISVQSDKNVCSQGSSNTDGVTVTEEKQEGGPSTNSAETPGSETGPRGRTDIASQNTIDSQETSSGSHTGASQPVAGVSAGSESTNQSTACTDTSSSSEHNVSVNSSGTDKPGDSDNVPPSDNKPDVEASDNDDVATVENAQSDPNNSQPLLDTADEDSFQEKLRKSIEKDAVSIFSKYISHDAPYPIKINDELRSQAISKICREDGQVDPMCFTACQEMVVDVMDKEYYSDFISSDFHCKHQIDILTRSRVHLADILYNDAAMFYFMEFMEQEKAANLLRFWIAIDNFQTHLSSQEGNYDTNQTQSDAMILYDKFFSLQASEPIGFDDKIRFEVEGNICREGGPLPDCFALPKRIVLKTVEKVYFEQFLKSELYFKYLNELINTVQSHDIAPTRRKRAGSDASSEHSVGSGSTASETVGSKNTLLATGSSTGQLKKACNQIHEDEMRIDAMLFNPDSLWKRNKAGNMTLGKINEVGQFISEFDPDPDHSKKKKSASFFKRRKEKDKAQEDMALQIAQMIINDVNTETGLSSPGTPESEVSQASQVSQTSQS